MSAARFLATAGLASLVAAPLAAENLARGRPYTWSRPPNYDRCTDNNDTAQLTDGKRAGNEYIWLDPLTVGWMLEPGDVVTLRFDLGRDCNLDSLVTSTAWFERADVWPPAVFTGISATPERFELAGSFDPARLAKPDPSRPARVPVAIPLHGARGRYVLVAMQLRHIALFCDELEIHGSVAPPLATPATAAKPGHTFTEADLPGALATQRRLWAVRKMLPSANAASGPRAGVDPLAGGGPGAAPGADPKAEERARLATRAQAWRAAGRPAIEVRRVDPWTPTNPWSEPLATMSDTLELWPGAWAAAALEVANAGTAPVRLRLADRNRQTTAGAPRTTLRDVLGVESRATGWARDALPKAADTLRVQPGEVRQIWIDIDASAARPGAHRVPVQVGSQTVIIPVRVHDVRMPPPPLGAINWTYASEFGLTRATPEAAIADNRAHGIDSWCLNQDAIPWPDPTSIDASGHLLRPPDFSKSDAQLALYNARQARMFGWYWDFKIDEADPSRGRFKHPYGSAAWQRAASEWLAAWMQHLRDAGYDPSRIFMQPIDERSDANVQKLYRMLHAAHPDVRFLLTVTHAASPEELRALQSDLAVVILEREALARHRDWVRDARARGVEVWSYDVIEPSKTEPPGPMYRLLVWESWARQLRGCGFWAYGDTGTRSGDAWNDYDDARADWSVVYGAEGAPQSLRGETFAPSKRWQAFRIGMQESALLEAALARNPGLRDELRAAFDGGTPPDPETIRRRLLRGR